MSMPHGETTGRSQPCPTCGLGPRRAQPKHMCELVAVLGDYSVNVSKEAGVHKPVGEHVVVGYPLVQQGQHVLMWVQSFYFPIKDGKDDGMPWDERVNAHTALTTVECDGFKNMLLCWVPAHHLLAALKPAGKCMPSELPLGGVWFCHYGYIGTNSGLSAPSHTKELTFSNVRRHLKSYSFKDPALPDEVMHWLPGFCVVPPEPAPPALVPLSAEAAPVARPMQQVRIPDLDAFKIGPVDFACDMGLMPPLPMKTVKKFKAGDKVVWDVIGCGYHFCAEVIAVSPVTGSVQIKLRDGREGWEHFRRMLHCPPHMLGWAAHDDVLWIHVPDDGVLRHDVFMAPPCISPPDHNAAALEEEGTAVPAQVELDTEEESEVWAAFAAYCANDFDIEDLSHGERALDFFIAMRRRLCAKLD